MMERKRRNEVGINSKAHSALFRPTRRDEE